MTVICDIARVCPEPMCGAKTPHEHDPKECGHCPKNRLAVCIPTDREEILERIETLEDQLDPTSVESGDPRLKRELYELQRLMLKRGG